MVHFNNNTVMLRMHAVSVNCTCEVEFTYNVRFFVSSSNIAVRESDIIGNKIEYQLGISKII